MKAYTIFHAKFHFLKVTKYLYASIVFVFAVQFFALAASAEVIGVENEERAFGDWKVFCQTDAMMDISDCKVAAKFYENTAVISIEPNTKLLNKLFVVIPQIRSESVVKIKVNGHDLIMSRSVKSSDFGLIALDEHKKSVLLSQMKSGDFLFLRFYTRDSDKEVTVRLSLKDFRSAMSYYNSKTLIK